MGLVIILLLGLHCKFAYSQEAKKGYTAGRPQHVVWWLLGECLFDFLHYLQPCLVGCAQLTSFDSD